MKDAKGHGSNPRGTAPGYAGRDQLGRTYTQAIRDHDRFPSQNPNMPNGEDYKTPDAAAATELARGSQKSAVVPAHAGTISGNQMDAYLRYARGFTGSGAVKEPSKRNVGRDK